MKLNKLLLLAPVSLILLSGCMPEEKSGTDLSHETTAQVGKKAAIKSKEVALAKLDSVHDVVINNQHLKVKATYGIQENRKNNWYFTQPSSVTLSLATQDLPKDVSVKVNEVYSDVSVSSKYARYNGVRQDSADLKYSDIAGNGITINDNNSYNVPFQVEGINSNQTSFYVINGYGSSSTHRITEKDMRKNSEGAVLKTVWTLLVTDKSGTYAKTISDSIGLPVK